MFKIQNPEKYLTECITVCQSAAKGFAVIMLMRGKIEVLAELRGITNVYNNVGVFGLLNKSSEDSDVEDEMANYLHSSTMGLFENLEDNLPSFFKKCAKSLNMELLTHWLNQTDDLTNKLHDFITARPITFDESTNTLLKLKSGLSITPCKHNCLF